MAEKLPAANVLLLKRLLSLLRRIARSAGTSRMSSSNLAICMGPSLLSPPHEDLLPLEAMLEATEKVRCLALLAAAFPARPILRAWLLRGLWLPPAWSEGREWERPLARPRFPAAGLRARL